MRQRLKKPGGVSLNARKQRVGYLFVLPFVIGCIIFFLSPTIFYVVMSFSKMSLTNNGMSFIYVGWDNFQEVLLNDPGYLTSIWEGLQPFLINLFAIVLYSLLVAILLNQKFCGRAFFRTMFFLPVVVASGSAALNSSNDQLLNNAQMLLGTSASAVDMGKDITEIIIQMFGANNATQSLVSIVSTIVSSMYDITQAAGVQILIFLAGLQAINVSLYEASRIDGATGWESFWKITLPMVSPMILVNVVYTIVDQLSSAGNATVTRMYEAAVGQLKYTYSAAMGVMYFSIVITILAVVVALVSRFVYYENRDDERRRRKK